MIILIIRLTYNRFTIPLATASSLNAQK